MALIRRNNDLLGLDPIRELREMSNRMDMLLGRTLGGDGQEALGLSTGWSPSANVSETDDEYLVMAELPAVQKSDVHVTLKNQILTIEGERKQRKEQKGERAHRVESYFGKFVRRFQMPDDADSDNVDASFKDGMLEIHIKKMPAAKTKGTEIKIK